MVEVAKAHVRSDELDSAALGHPRQRGCGCDPHRLAVREVEGAAGGEHMAAAGTKGGQGQALERPAVDRLQRRFRSLGAEVAVPDHLREPHRHREPPRVQSQGSRIHADEREIEARVPRIVVVAQQRHHGRETGVPLAAEHEVASHPEQEAVDADLHARTHPRQRTVGLEEGDRRFREFLPE
jgi:hypothetical protein